MPMSNDLPKIESTCITRKVQKDSGNAKWDKLQGILSVCVPIDQKVLSGSREATTWCKSCSCTNNDRH